MLQSHHFWQQPEKLVLAQDSKDPVREYPCSEALLSLHHVGRVARNYP